MSDRPLYKVAQEIQSSWKTMSDHASPYVEAMSTLTSIDEDYYFDSGREIVMRFLANAQYWRGEDAKRIKKELNGLL